MTIQSNFPSIRPSLLLDFANSKVLDPRITFTRASTATYYDGVTTALAEQNLLTYSQDFDNVGGWGITNSTISANSTTAPNGTSTADTFLATASTGLHRLSQSAVTTGTTRTFSVFAKASTNNFIQFYLGSDGNAYANFNVTAGSGAVGTVGSSATASIVDVGNGWYRCVMTTSSATADAGFNITLIDSATSARAQSWTTVGTEAVFLWGAQLEQRSSVTAYTATTTQPITNYIPVLKTAASGVARFDHNPTTDESLGLLIEEQRTNLLTYSEQFDNAAWVAGKSAGASVSANTVVSPGGTITADTVTFTASSDYLYQAISNYPAVTGAAVVFSIYAKTATQIIIFGGGSPTGTDVYATTSVGNGWFRQTLTRTFTETTSARPLQTLPSGTYVGAGSFYIWGAQLEVGSFATSYIATTSSQVTRSADAASMTGTNFSSWFSAGQGTFYAEYAVSETTSRPIFVPRATATSGDRIQLASSKFSVINGGVVQADIGSGTNITSGKQAAAYNVNDFATIIQGLPVSTSVITDTSGTVPAVDYATIGYFDFGGNARLNGTIKKIAYYPLRVTNAQLQALTS